MTTEALDPAVLDAQSMLLSFSDALNDLQRLTCTLGVPGAAILKTLVDQYDNTVMPSVNEVLVLQEVVRSNMIQS